MELDFPYCSGKPVAVRGGGWVILLGSVALAYATLVSIKVAGFPATLLPAVLFAGIPLLALAWLTGRHWKALFRPVGAREFRLMVMFAALTITASIVAALLVGAVGTTAVPNPIVAGMKAMSLLEFVALLAPTLAQLLGEELLTILPFLAILWLLTQRLGWTQRPAVILALIGSSALFAAAHLPTYDWHWGQCFGVIGTARIILTLAYIRTRNLWVSTGAHIINDWAEFILSFGLSHLPIGST